MDIWGISDIGNVRTVNQDRIAVLRDGNAALLAVADGMGGMEHGDAASSLFIGEIEKWWEKNSAHIKGLDCDRLEMEIYDEFFDINAKICRFKKESNIRTGTTASVVVINGGSAVMAYSGDTRIYRIDAKNRAELLSEDESLYNYIEKSEDEEENTLRNNSILLSYMGKGQNLTVSLKSLKISSEDIFIIATDGFYSYFDIGKRENILMARSLGAREFAEQARAMVKAKRAADNLSMIIAKKMEEL